MIGPQPDHDFLRAIVTILNKEHAGICNQPKHQIVNNPLTIGAEEIGRTPLDVDSAFEGLIDEVRLYNRVLSDAKISALFAMEGAL